MSHKTRDRIQNAGLLTLILVLIWTLFMANAHASGYYGNGIVAYRSNGVVAYRSNHITLVVPLQDSRVVYSDRYAYRQLPPIIRYEPVRVQPVYTEYRTVTREVVRDSRSEYERGRQDAYDEIRRNQQQDEEK
jgi:hypothetical protein